MRIQALRCHVIYKWSGTRLHVIPVLASRSQALRYSLVFISSPLESRQESFGAHRTLEGSCSIFCLRVENIFVVVVVTC